MRHTIERRWPKDEGESAGRREVRIMSKEEVDIIAAKEEKSKYTLTANP